MKRVAGPTMTTVTNVAHVPQQAQLHSSPPHVSTTFHSKHLTQCNTTCVGLPLMLAVCVVINDENLKNEYVSKLNGTVTGNTTKKEQKTCMPKCFTGISYCCCSLTTTE